jgi:hypothetical protein
MSTSLLTDRGQPATTAERSGRLSGAPASDDGRVPVGRASTGS